jgi:endonuclease/exonuclease/phosphatase family metal-dependent hydrolase
MKKKKLTFFNRVLLLINLIFVLALLLSAASPSISPSASVIPAVFGLFYPVLLFFNLLFFVYWLTRLRLYLLFSLVAILLGFNMFFKTFAFNKEKPVGRYDDALKVLSYNVRLFDQFKWTGNQNYFTRNSVFEFVHHQQADVICFQEFFHGNEKYFPTIQPFLDKTEAENYHVDYMKVVGDSKHFGLATFTRFPIVGKGSIRFDNAVANSGIYTDILFKNDTIRIFNFHLESIGFSKADQKFVSEMIYPGSGGGSSNLSNILRKLNNAFRNRAEQIEVVMQKVNQSPYPVIVCGDFNDTPASFAYNRLAAELGDAFLDAGAGLGSTYAGSLPFLRIDYILHDPSLLPFRFEVHDVTYSDHFPVSCYFKPNKLQ